MDGTGGRMLFRALVVAVLCVSLGECTAYHDYLCRSALHVRLRYFPADMPFARAEQTCKENNGFIAPHDSCTKGFISELTPTGGASKPVIWLAKNSSAPGVSSASDGSQHKQSGSEAGQAMHKVVCRIALEHHTCGADAASKTRLLLLGADMPFMQARAYCASLGMRLTWSKTCAKQLVQSLGQTGKAWVEGKVNGWFRHDTNGHIRHPNEHLRVVCEAKFDDHTEDLCLASGSPTRMKIYRGWIGTHQEAQYICRFRGGTLVSSPACGAALTRLVEGHQHVAWTSTFKGDLALDSRGIYRPRRERANVVCEFTKKKNAAQDPTSLPAEDYKCPNLPNTHYRFFNVELAYFDAVEFCSKIHGSIVYNGACSQSLHTSLLRKAARVPKPGFWLENQQGSHFQRLSSDGALSQVLSDAKKKVVCEIPHSTFNCPHRPAVTLKYFPVMMDYPKAKEHCAKFGAQLPRNSTKRCMTDFLRTTGRHNPSAWLAHRSAGEKKLVVCEFVPVMEYLCTEATLGIYANTATYDEAREQCSRLGGRLPAGPHDEQCLANARKHASASSPAKQAKPWLVYDQEGVRPSGNSYVVHDLTKSGMSDAVGTVGCMFNFREFFCATDHSARHYPHNTRATTLVFIPRPAADLYDRVDLSHFVALPPTKCERYGGHKPRLYYEFYCGQRLMEVIKYETGFAQFYSQQPSYKKFTCVFPVKARIPEGERRRQRAKGRSPKQPARNLGEHIVAEHVCGNWRVQILKDTFRKATYRQAQQDCQRDIGFFLPSENFWKNLLVVMKADVSNPACLEVASTFQDVPIWYNIHGVARSNARFSYVCVGAVIQNATLPFGLIWRYPGVASIDESGHVTCKLGFKKPLQEDIPGYAHIGFWQQTAGCYEYVNFQEHGHRLHITSSNGQQLTPKVCAPRTATHGWQATYRDGTIRCPVGQLWVCSQYKGTRCPTFEDRMKQLPVCLYGQRVNYAECISQTNRATGVTIPIAHLDSIPRHHLDKRTGSFKCYWPMFESCGDPPCAGGRNRNPALFASKRQGSSRINWYKNLPACLYLESLQIGHVHWYRSSQPTTYDRASMACENMGTRLMTLDEVLVAMDLIVTKATSVANQFIWVTDTASGRPVTIKLTTGQHGKHTTARFMCLASPNAQVKAQRCWSGDSLYLAYNQGSHYKPAIEHCAHRRKSKIPPSFLHYCLDALIRWQPYYESYWFLGHRTNKHHAWGNDLLRHNVKTSLPVMCWRERAEDDPLMVEHECSSFNLYHLIQEQRSYLDAWIMCGKRNMVIPPSHINSCVHLFVTKMHERPAWVNTPRRAVGTVSGWGTSHVANARTPHTVICAKAK
ncbi:uncharacterized protein LOC135827576 [Sycon ciliatum]|uniref:uncharacterized protein LOC135827576 n=1 Tax=Sycon ciliatum TaxID=27933 RepID=UPI0031F715BA